MLRARMATWEVAPPSAMHRPAAPASTSGARSEGDLPGGDDGASRHPQWRGVAEQYPQHAFSRSRRSLARSASSRLPSAWRISHWAWIARCQAWAAPTPWSISMSAASSRPGSSSSARCAEKIAASFSSPPSLACCRLPVRRRAPVAGPGQGEVLFLGTMPAVIRRQADGAGAAPGDRWPGRAKRRRRSGYRRQPQVAPARPGRWRAGPPSEPRGGAGEGREQGVEGRLAVFAATDHLYLVLFGDPRPMMPTRLSTLATCPAKCSSAWLEKPCAVFRSSAAGRACRPP